MATKFTYKMRSGGNGMWGRGPAQRKNNIKKKKICTILQPMGSKGRYQTLLTKKKQGELD
jgi:hypothetical protein